MSSEHVYKQPKHCAVSLKLWLFATAKEHWANDGRTVEP